MAEIQRFEFEGTLEELGEICGLAFCNSCLYVADFSNNRVISFDGALKAIHIESVQTPGALASANGKLFVSNVEGWQVHIFGPAPGMPGALRLEDSLHLQAKPWGVATDTTGLCFVSLDDAEIPRVVIFNLANHPRSAAGLDKHVSEHRLPLQMQDGNPTGAPRGLTLNEPAGGKLYVATSEGSVFVLDVEATRSAGSGVGDANRTLPVTVVTSKQAARPEETLATLAMAAPQLGSTLVEVGDGEATFDKPSTPPAPVMLAAPAPASVDNEDLAAAEAEERAADAAFYESCRELAEAQRKHDQAVVVRSEAKRKREEVQEELEARERELKRQKKKREREEAKAAEAEAEAKAAEAGRKAVEAVAEAQAAAAEAERARACAASLDSDSED